MTFDVTLRRTLFPAFATEGMEKQIFAENAGGSFPCRHTIDALHDHYTRIKLQPYQPNPQGLEAGAAMESSHRRWAEALGVETEEITFGPSTSANAYVLAQAFATWLPDDAEIIVTNQDHEANSGAMRRMATLRGLTLHEWRIREDGQLHLEDLQKLLTHRTRLVCFPHCSNIIGNENPAGDWTLAIKSDCPECLVMVDGVSHAPHNIPDIGAIGCDVYMFSLYKVYSVHQGLLVVRKPLLFELPNQSHYFNNAYPEKRLNPAGPDHAQVACADAVLDYLEELAPEASTLADAVRVTNRLWHDQEEILLKSMLTYLEGHNRLTLLGSHDSKGRHPTFALQTRRDPVELSEALGAAGIMCGAGDFYAVRCLEGLGIDPARGVLRLSLVHYNSLEDVQAICTKLDQLA